MSTWWKLPDVLGGAVVQQTDANHDFVWVDVPGLADLVRLRKQDLTEAKEPCPPEPGPEATLLDRTGRAWQCFDFTGPASGKRYWKCVDGVIYGSWEELWDQRGPMTHMVSSGTEPRQPQPIRWTQAFGNVTDSAIWTGYTAGGTLVRVFNVNRKPALEQGRKSYQRVRVEAQQPGTRSVQLSFTPQVARDFAEALVYASGANNS